MTTLAAWYHGDNNADDSVNGINGTWVRTPHYEAGISGNCFSLQYDVGAGGDAYIRIPYDSRLAFSGAQQFSVFFWCKGYQSPLPSPGPGGLYGNYGRFYIASGSSAFPTSPNWQLFFDEGNEAGNARFIITVGDIYSGGLQQFYNLDPLFGADIITHGSFRSCEITYLNGTWQLYVATQLVTPSAYYSMPVPVNTDNIYIESSAIFNGAGRSRMLVEDVKFYTPYEPPTPVLNRNVVITCCDA